MRTMGAGEFKAKCLAVMDDVAASGEPVLITKRGKPVVRLVPSEEASVRKVDVDSIHGALRGFITQTDSGALDDLVNPIFPIEDWDILKEDGLFPPE